MEIIDGKMLLVATAQPEHITSVIPKSKVVGYDGDEHEVAVHWGLEEAAILTALGFTDVPSPILEKYQWTGKHTPFAHQKITSAFLTLNPRAFCFSEAGTGKTASTIWAADYLMKLGHVTRVLVLCPLSIMKAAWQQDLFKFAMHRSVSIAHGDAKQRVKIIEAGSDFVVINFDGVAVVKDAIINGGFDLIIVDEATAFKNAQTNRWKTFRDVLNATNPRLWMLTGTPAAQSPLDAYGLAKLVNPSGTPRVYGQFRDSIMFKLTQFKWVARDNAQAVVHKMLQPAIRFEKRQCLDLPPVTHVDRDAPLTVMQQKYYNTLKREMLFEAAGEEVSAINAAAKLNKLLQISGGAVYTDTGETIEFDVSNRLKVVVEAIRETSNKVLVFVPFTHTITLMKEELDRQKINCAVINGSVSLNKRSEIVQDFQTRADPHVLIIQPAAASHGLTLTAADTVIWYSPVTSVETYLQANARIDRPGQHNPMTIVHIRGSEIENRLYSMLKDNIGNHQKVVDLYQQEIANTP